MFADHTKSSILALATIDDGVTEAERNSLLSVLTGGRVSAESIIHYSEAAKRLNLSVATVKRLAAQGRLKRVVGVGSRACGITAESVASFAR